MVEDKEESGDIDSPIRNTWKEYLKGASRNVTLEGRKSSASHVLGRDWNKLFSSTCVVPSLLPLVGAPRENKVTWKWKQFSNTARQDNLKLFHWEKKPCGEEKEHPFAKYKKEAKIMKYSESEYPIVSTATNNSSAWTKEETDLLFELCEKYNLRFAVIADRWPDEKWSMDDLKDRYYSIARKIVELRNFGPESRSSVLFKHCQALIANPFDIEYERERKKQLETQLTRPKTEVLEEEKVVQEARRIESNRKRRAKERQRMQNLLLKGGDIRHPASAYASPTLQSPNIQKAHHTSPHLSGLPLSEKYDAKNTFPHRKTHSGAYERSSLLYTPVTQSSRNMRRVESLLEEVGVGLRPIPTCTVVDEFDYLRLDILNFLESEKIVIRKEWEVYNLKTKLCRLKGEEPPPLPAILAEQSQKQNDGHINTSHKKRRSGHSSRNK
eukprot:jgi/Galph1/3107/GphlegSOOS_G1767.1